MLPFLFRIGAYAQSTYGLLVALAFLAALWMAARLAREDRLNAESVLNLGIYCALIAIAGAKLFMFILDAGYYFQNPREIFSMNALRAGGVFYGGFVPALVFAIFYMRRYGLPWLATADAFAPGIALGHSIGRVGCFCAGCCWGIQCHLPWAVTFTSRAAHDNVGVPLNVPLHPTQLYEALAEAIIFVVLYFRFHRPHRAGQIIGLYLVLYSTARFFIEFVRAHDEANPLALGLSLEQWIAAALVATGVILLTRPGKELTLVGNRK
jgi:phosphatidylglycerol:prolipoprotein diacylglycerol transferase